MNDLVESDYHGAAILTVGQLRSALDGLPDDYHVLVATESWYNNIEAVEVPNRGEEDCTCCVNLLPTSTLITVDGSGGDFDTRQF